MKTASTRYEDTVILSEPYKWTDWTPGPTKPTITTVSGPIAVAGTPTPDFPYEDRRRVVGELVQDGYWVKATGSRVTQDGWTTYSDWNYVVFDPEVKLHTKLISQGWTDGTSGRDDGSFASLRSGEVNLILVKEEDQWKKWIIATNMIKALNSKTKEERVKVFDGVFGKDSNAEAVMF